MDRPRGKIVGIDLFAGAGGLSLGARMAGIPTEIAIEANSAAANTYRLNHPGTRVLEGDICRFEPPPKARGALTFLFGGPPCQGFSTSNQRTRGTDNVKNWLFTEMLRFAGALKPDWVVIENVTGLRETAQGLFERSILGGLANLGFGSDVWALSATNYGVPQMRSRLFIVARRGGDPPQPPPCSHSAAITVKEAISDLPMLVPGASTDELQYRSARPSKYAQQMRGDMRTCCGHLVTANSPLVIKRYAHIPQGGNWRDIPRRLMKNYTNLVDGRSRHTGIYRRLSWEDPSVVIANYRKNMLIHPSQDRGLSVREAARLQSFPDSFKFFGSIGQRQQQVSNAVPPLLAKAVFSHLLAHS